MNEVSLPIEDLFLLIDGCFRHPPYRGVREPKGDCEVCLKIYKLRASLNQHRPTPPTVIYDGLSDPNCNYCNLGKPHSPVDHHRELTLSKRRA